jgi:hypothetical protein
MSSEERKACGIAGREWVTSQESMMSARCMSERFIECINTCLSLWTPRKRFTVFKVEQEPNFDKVGII